MLEITQGTTLLFQKFLHKLAFFKYFFYIIDTFFRTIFHFFSGPDQMACLMFSES